MQRSFVQFVAVTEDGLIQPKDLQSIDPDGYESNLKFRNLEWGFELSGSDTAFYGLYSGGQHGRYEVTLSLLAFNGDNVLLGKASISFGADLGEWFNKLLNKYFDECLASRLRVKNLVQDLANKKSMQNLQ